MSFVHVDLRNIPLLPLPGTIKFISVKKCLDIPKSHPYAVNRRRTDNAMDKRKGSELLLFNANFFSYIMARTS
jgi:hypothetical protein